jgi:hypothetical protein
VATVISRCREWIPELMAEQGVPGLAVALVDGDRALWVQGFGYRDHQGGAPVTADTIFSVQSMSKGVHSNGCHSSDRRRPTVDEEPNDPGRLQVSVWFAGLINT